MRLHPTTPALGGASCPTDPLWALAATTPVFTADAHVVAGLAGTGAGDAPADGVVVARRHATGWFLHAVQRCDLGEDVQRLFTDLVVVRTYLLLTRGPSAPMWQPVPDEPEWRSPAGGLASGLAHQVA